MSEKLQTQMEVDIKVCLTEIGWKGPVVGCCEHCNDAIGFFYVRLKLSSLT